MDGVNSEFGKFIDLRLIISSSKVVSVRQGLMIGLARQFGNLRILDECKNMFFPLLLPLAQLALILRFSVKKLVHYANLLF